MEQELTTEALVKVHGTLLGDVFHKRKILCLEGSEIEKKKKNVKINILIVYLMISM